MELALAEIAGAEGLAIIAATQIDWRTEAPVRWELLDVAIRARLVPEGSILVRIESVERVDLDEITTTAGVWTATASPRPDTGPPPDEPLRRELYELAERARRLIGYFPEAYRIPRPDGDLTAWIDAVGGALGDRVSAGQRYKLLATADRNLRALTLRVILREAGP